MKIDDYAVAYNETKLIPKQCELCGTDIPQQMPDVIYEIELKKFIWAVEKRRWKRVALPIFVCKACQDEILRRYERRSDAEAIEEDSRERGGVGENIDHPGDHRRSDHASS